MAGVQRRPFPQAAGVGRREKVVNFAPELLVIVLDGEAVADFTLHEVRHKRLLRVHGVCGNQVSGLEVDHGQKLHGRRDLVLLLFNEQACRHDAVYGVVGIEHVAPGAEILRLGG